MRVALGEPLTLRQEEVLLRGHAIECRINAEDPSAGFLPSPGTITAYREPSGPGVRVDSGVAAGSVISPLYDPMVAKLIVHGVDRKDAIGKMLRALGEYQVGGVKTLIGFHRALLSHPCFGAGETCHGVVESAELAARAEELAVPAEDRGFTAAATIERTAYAEVDGRRVEVKVQVPEPPYRALGRRRRERAAAAGAAAGGAVVSPMQGTVLDVKVADGDSVEVGQVICIVEAMKMENEVTAAVAGTVSELAVAPLQPISVGERICVVV
jgi:acetyl-CoA/propionyl-CoA carboxylase biotin carboxyl carrier protein